MHLEQKIQLVFIIALVGLCFYVLSPILSPFLFAALLAYLGDPLVDRLEKRMSRTFAVVSVFIFIIITLILIVMLFIPLISEQLSKLIGKLPGMIDLIEKNILPTIQDKFAAGSAASSDDDLILNTLKSNLSNLSNIASKLFGWISNSSGFVLTLLANIFLVPVVTFYLLRDWDRLIERIHHLIPRRYEAKVSQIAKESDNMLAAFLRGQFMVMNSLGLIYAIGLSVVGLESAILIGFIAGWLSFVPYLGLVVGMGVATALAYFQFGDIMHPLGVIITFVIAQALEGSVLTPRFVGERIGLHPVAVIFAVLAGGQLAGFAGVLLALPVAAVLNVLVSHAHVAYQHSKLYN
ncbi:AI-2E family transporter [Ostreibacterium oceani]|uniref:AI-2E family transporter n=1 Tax=Ostreibacterium oceani TaxID=2654998 RepID=A0A6N7EX95_9GAMM|nr:AI-2E family transporter [Ostreibacterium oceani]MPV86563.1 AI-2E family transporter [Ostreibacterium oceani]